MRPRVGPRVEVTKPGRSGQEPPFCLDFLALRVLGPRDPRPLCHSWWPCHASPSSPCFHPSWHQLRSCDPALVGISPPSCAQVAKHVPRAPVSVALLPSMWSVLQFPLLKSTMVIQLVFSVASSFMPASWHLRRILIASFKSLCPPGGHQLTAVRWLTGTGVHVTLEPHKLRSSPRDQTWPY